VSVVEVRCERARARKGGWRVWDGWGKKRWDRKKVCVSWVNSDIKEEYKRECVCRVTEEVVGREGNEEVKKGTGERERDGGAGQRPSMDNKSKQEACPKIFEHGAFWWGGVWCEFRFPVI